MIPFSHHLRILLSHRLSIILHQGKVVEQSFSLSTKFLHLQLRLSIFIGPMIGPTGRHSRSVRRTVWAESERVNSLLLPVGRVLVPSSGSCSARLFRRRRARLGSPSTMSETRCPESRALYLRSFVTAGVFRLCMLF